MRKKFLGIALFVLLVFLQGCNTLKGAGQGLKEDWKILSGVDEWIQEKMW